MRAFLTLRRYRLVKESGITRLEFAVATACVLLLAAVLAPAFRSMGEYWRYQSCDSNMKEMATAIQMYWNDYQGALPSSALRHSKPRGKWDQKASVEFCCELGQIPPPEQLKPKDVHWIQVIWPHLKNKDVIWCRSDGNRPRKVGFFAHKPGKKDLASYFYKPAVDKAWFDSSLPIDPDNPRDRQALMHFRKETDFANQADQIILFERYDRHWRKGVASWKNGQILVAAFLDGHVRPVRLSDGVGCDIPVTASDVEKSMSGGGEPLWFNAKREKDKVIRGKECYFDPRVYFDDLP